jgi:hypothetical protein
MGRVAATAFCVGLLCVAATAFTLTESAKTQLSAVYGTKVDRIFSPICDLRYCRTRRAEIQFQLRKPAILDVWMKADRSRVATLVTGKAFPRGPVHLFFTGRLSDGALLPDGAYLPEVRIEHGADITLPNPIVIDTRPVEVRPFSTKRRWIVTRGLGASPHELRVPYRLTGSAHAVLLIGRRQVAFTYRQRPAGVLVWNGTFSGHPVKPGRYAVEVADQDAAGNRAAPATAGVVTVRESSRRSPGRRRLRARHTVAPMTGRAS